MKNRENEVPDVIGNHKKRQNIVFRDPQKTFFIFVIFLHDFFTTLGVISGSSRSDFFVVVWCLQLVLYS